MVIEAHEPRRSSLPGPAKSSPPNDGQPGMAPPWDRAAAAVIDGLLVLGPVLVLIGAPLKKVMLEAVVLDSQLPFARAIAIAAAAAMAVIIAYQTLMVYYFGGTLGKRAFGLRVVDVWHHTRPSFGACLTRAAVVLLEALLLGLPWLAVFANARRRPMHDRLADTVVITTRRPVSAAPGIMEATFIRGVHSAVWAAVSLALITGGLEILRNMESEQTVLSWLDEAQDESESCQAVTDALAGRPSNLKTEERLESAMELFAAGLVDAVCVEQEADRVMNMEDGQIPLAYLAKAFASAEEAELSNAYLKKACELGPLSEVCMMTDIVQKWSEEDWDKVAELFAALPTPSSGHVSIWKARYFMKQGMYEQALHILNSLSGQSSLAAYLIPERAKALWRANQFEQSRLVAFTAFETLKGKDRMNLAGWMCYEELARSCTPHGYTSCEQFVQDAHEQTDSADLQPAGWLAMIMLKEKCHTAAPANDYAEMKEAAQGTAAEKLFDTLEAWARGDAEKAHGQITEFIKDEKQPETLRTEALRRLVMWSEQSDDLKPWIDHWEDLKPGHRRAVGPVLFRALKARGRLAEALNVGWRLLDENRADLQINRELVVTAYQLGRRKDAWKLLRSYRERYDIINQSRTPAAIDEFVAIAKLLTKEYGD